MSVRSQMQDVATLLHIPLAWVNRARTFDKVKDAPLSYSYREVVRLHGIALAAKGLEGDQLKAEASLTFIAAEGRKLVMDWSR